MAGKQLFGTDGIRGVAGEYPLDDRTAYAFGLALGDWVTHHQVMKAETNGHRSSDGPEIVLGMDTRESGPRLAGWIAGGLAARGVRTRFAGVVSTPGIAYLTRTDAFVAGVMISASHNPYQDNGIKVFGHSGYKLPDDDEHTLEQAIFAALEQDLEPAWVSLNEDPGLDQRYIDFLAGLSVQRLDGVRLVLDCGNGAVSHLAPALFSMLGAQVIATHDQPDGRNINAGCGALYVESLRKTVVAERADAGVAFDGDADRAIFIAASGKIVDGDAVLLMTAMALEERGLLSKRVVVATVMSNLGLEAGLKQRGIDLVRTPVGDKYVLEEMVRIGAPVGGEQSGHIIFRDCATTGDGMLTALRVFELMRHTGKSLEDLSSALEIYPQTLVNVRVKEKRSLEDLTLVRREIAAAEARFGASGRVLVRFSGTEPLARVMVEGPDKAHVVDAAKRIADAIRLELGD